MYKLFCLVACLAVASAQVLKADEEYDPNPSYSFSYEVQDPLTGDSKSQSESRQGDVVQGSYTLIEADGSRRTVNYNADPENGFNAEVRKEAAGAPVKALKLAAPKPVARAPIALAPAQIAYHTPIAYHAPIAYAHAPVAVAHAPVAVAHAPALVHSAFNTPYATYAF